MSKFIKFNKDKFDMIVQKHGLRKVSSNYVFLLDCNLMFEYKNGEVYARGVIPMDLANEMYETFKDMDFSEIPFANCNSHDLVKPEDVANYPSFDLGSIEFVAMKTGKSLDEVMDEARKEALEKDYDNCYIDFSYIYSAEAMNWFIETTLAYYNRKKALNATQEAPGK